MLSHPVICSFLLLAKNYLRTSDVICVYFLRCANKECECSYQNGILNGLFPNLYDKFWNSKDVASGNNIHPSKFNLLSICPFNIWQCDTMLQKHHDLLGDNYFTKIFQRISATPLSRNAAPVLRSIYEMVALVILNVYLIQRRFWCQACFLCQDKCIITYIFLALYESFFRVSYRVFRKILPWLLFCLPAAMSCHLSLENEVGIY